jgi:RHS repeat-associated protein
LLSASGSVTGSISAYSQYDIAGSVVKGIDGRGNATILEYDDRYGTPDGSATTNPGPTDLGGLTSWAFATRINLQGQIATAQFDYYLGRIVDGQDVNGIVASASYNDSLDRPTEVKRAVSTAAANRTVYSYDDTNRIITTTSDLNVNNDGALIGKTVYDQMGRTCETRQYEGGTNYIATQVQYDALGRAHKTSNPFRPWQSQTAVWTTKGFDALGRLTSITTPDNAVVTSSYSGNAVTVTDQAGKARKSLTDSLGRLTSVYEDPSGLNYQTSYTYDVLDNLTTVTQGVQTRTYVYDSLKRLTSSTNPESGTMTLGYDSNGNVTTRLDARNITTTMTYDALNRITSKSTNDNPQTPTVNFYYDGQSLPSGAPSYDRGFATGRLVAVTYGGTSAGTYVGYDQMGRVVRQYQRTDSVNYLVEASYFANSSIQSLTYPSVPGAGDRRVVNYTNDSAGRTASVNSPARTYSPAASVSSIGYAPHNGLSSQTLGNNLINAVSYNNRFQAIEIKLGTSGSPSSIIDLDYTYGTTTNNGNVQSIAYSGGGLTYMQTFGYDALNRLTTAQENGGANWSQTNGYDRYGNRWISLGGGSQSLYFTATNNRITGWSYDNVGNLLNDTIHTYAYDANNKVSKVNGTSAYVYDGTGQRVRKLVGENVRFVYGINGELVAEFSGASGALLKEYVYGPGGLLATIEPTAINTNGTRYTTSDHLGSPRVITNSSSGVVSRHDYMPFGEEIGSGIGGRTAGMGFSVTDGVRQKFTRQERDSETGLDYFKARYYSSLQGRFTSADSVGGSAQNPQTLNLYAYTMGNPLRFIDPTGNSSEAAHGESEQRQIKGGCNHGRGSLCMWMGQDPKKVEQKPPTVLGPAGSDGSREIPGDGDVLVINSKPANQPAISANDGLSDTSFAFSAGGFAASGGEFHFVNGSSWRGVNGKWNDMSWGGNGYTGGRSLAVAKAGAFRVANKAFFFAGAGISGYQLFGNVRTGNYAGAAKNGLDVGMSAAATFGGPYGLAIGGTYFVGDTIGWKNISDSHERLVRDVERVSGMPYHKYMGRIY